MVEIVSQREVARRPVATSSESSDQTGSVIIWRLSSVECLITLFCYRINILNSYLTTFSQGLGLAIGAALMDVKKATTFASVTIMTFMLSGGFFVQKVPFFMSWIHYLSFNYHTFRLLLKIQYGCSNLSPYASTRCKSPFIEESSLGNGGKEVGIMIAMVIGYRILAYIFLRRMRLRKNT